VVEKRLAIANDLFGLLFVDGEAAEFGTVKHLFDLGSKAFALRGTGRDLIFQSDVDGIAIGMALDARR
jgi:hypothetical protein